MSRSVRNILKAVSFVVAVIAAPIICGLFVVFSSPFLCRFCLGGLLWILAIPITWLVLSCLLTFAIDNFDKPAFWKLLRSFGPFKNGSLVILGTTAIVVLVILGFGFGSFNSISKYVVAKAVQQEQAHRQGLRCN